MHLGVYSNTWNATGQGLVPFCILSIHLHAYQLAPAGLTALSMACGYEEFRSMCNTHPCIHGTCRCFIARGSAAVLGCLVRASFIALFLHGCRHLHPSKHTTMHAGCHVPLLVSHSLLLSFAPFLPGVGGSGTVLRSTWQIRHG